MTTSFDWRDIAAGGDVKPCPKCQAVAFVTAVEFQRGPNGAIPVRPKTPARFCVECGYEEA